MASPHRASMGTSAWHEVTQDMSRSPRSINDQNMTRPRSCEPNFEHLRASPSPMKVFSTGKVFANFSEENDAQYTLLSRVREDTWRPKSARVSRTRYSASVSDKGRLPLMLLPKAKAREHGSFQDYVRQLRRGSVLSSDPRSQIILTTDSARIRVDLPRADDSMSINSDSEHGSSCASSPGDITPEAPKETNSYLDSFVNFSHIIGSFRHRRKSKHSAKSSVSSVSTKSKQSTLEEDLCPLCVQLIGGKDKLIQWIQNWYALQKREIQQALLPKHNNVYRGDSPHYCSFVRKVQLHKREYLTQPGQGSPRQAFIDPGPDADGVDGKSVQDGDTELSTDIKESDSVVNTQTEEASKDSWPSGIGVQVTSTVGSNSQDNATPRPDTPAHPPVTEPVTEEDKPREDGPIRIPSPLPEPIKPPPVTPSTAWTDPPNLSPKYQNPPPSPTVPVSPEKPPRSSSTVKPRSSGPKKTPINLSSPAPSSGQSSASKPRQRTCVTKKEKKSGERRKRGKSKEQPAAMAQERKPEPEPDPNIPSEELPQETEDPKVPELPQYEPEKPKETPKRGKPERSSINFSVIDNPFRPDFSELVDQEMKMKRYEYNPADTPPVEDLMHQKPKVTPSNHGRLALSQQSSRFELPMDMRLLETMSPQDYLKKYCVISTRRHNLYHRIFLRHKDKSGGLFLKELERALRDVLSSTVNTTDFKEMCDLVELEENTKVDFRLFAGIAAMAERILYPRFLTEDTVDIMEHKKEKIECADFYCLDWKCHGINVNPLVRKILEAL